jgi:hypothetical protein
MRCHGICAVSRVSWVKSTQVASIVNQDLDHRGETGLFHRWERWEEIVANYLPCKPAHLGYSHA